MKRQKRSCCPITFALDIIGDKWSLLVIRDMVLFNKRYYHEFMDSAESISTNILADRLQKLEQKGLIHKKNDENHGKKFIYSPTEKGLDLLPTIIEMIQWSTKYDPDTRAPASQLKKINQSKTKYIEAIKEKFSY